MFGLPWALSSCYFLLLGSGAAESLAVIPCVSRRFIVNLSLSPRPIEATDAWVYNQDIPIVLEVGIVDPKEVHDPQDEDDYPLRPIATGRMALSWRYLRRLHPRPLKFDPNFQL